MSFKLIQLPASSSVVQRRPLTKLALDNKIRAMISQFHPRERQFARIFFDHTNDVINTSSSSIQKEYLIRKPSFININSTRITNDTIKSDDFSLINKQTDEGTYKKVTDWLEYIPDNGENKELNTI